MNFAQANKRSSKKIQSFGTAKLTCIQQGQYLKVPFNSDYSSDTAPKLSHEVLRQRMRNLVVLMINDGSVNAVKALEKF